MKGGKGSHDRLLVFDNGNPMRRAYLQSVSGRAGIALGVDPGRLGSHSLRFGGASALWARYHDAGVVKRWGRWASDTFQGYLWEGREGAAGVSTAMVEADLTPV